MPTADTASFHAIQKVASRLEKESGAEGKTVGTTVLRVAQLDSERLTYEAWSQLKQQFRKAFTFLDFANGWELELDTVLSLLVFRYVGLFLWEGRAEDSLLTEMGGKWQKDSCGNTIHQNKIKINSKQTHNLEEEPDLR